MAQYLSGIKRRELVRDLAEGALSTADLAVKYEITEGYVNRFAGRNREQIFSLRFDPDDEIGALWISRLAARVESLQADVEHIDELLEEGKAGRTPARLLEVKHAALRQAAEQLGQLRPDPYGNGAIREIEYRVVGVDPALIAQPADSNLALGRGFDDEQPA